MTDPFSMKERTHPDDVLAVVVDQSGFTRDELTGPCREQPLTGWRQVAMAACRETSGWSFPAIGRYFGRDHTTVIHACQKVEASESARRCRSLVVEAVTNTQGTLAL